MVTMEVYLQGAMDVVMLYYILEASCMTLGGCLPLRYGVRDFDPIPPEPSWADGDTQIIRPELETDPGELGHSSQSRMIFEKKRDVSNVNMAATKRTIFADECERFVSRVAMLAIEEPRTSRQIATTNGEIETKMRLPNTKAKKTCKGAFTNMPVHKYAYEVLNGKSRTRTNSEISPADNNNHRPHHKKRHSTENPSIEELMSQILNMAWTGTSNDDGVTASVDETNNHITTSIPHSTSAESEDLFQMTGSMEHFNSEEETNTSSLSSTSPTQIQHPHMITSRTLTHTSNNTENKINKQNIPHTFNGFKILQNIRGHNTDEDTDTGDAMHRKPNFLTKHFLDIEMERNRSPNNYEIDYTTNSKEVEKELVESLTKDILEKKVGGKHKAKAFKSRKSKIFKDDKNNTALKNRNILENIKENILRLDISSPKGPHNNEIINTLLALDAKLQKLVGNTNPDTDNPISTKYFASVTDTYIIPASTLPTMRNTNPLRILTNASEQAPILSTAVPTSDILEKQLLLLEAKISKVLETLKGSNNTTSSEANVLLGKENHHQEIIQSSTNASIVSSTANVLKENVSILPKELTQLLNELKLISDNVPNSYNDSHIYGKEPTNNYTVMQVNKTPTVITTPAVHSLEDIVQNSIIDKLLQLKSSINKELNNVTVNSLVTLSYPRMESDNKIADNRLLFRIENKNTTGTPSAEIFQKALIDQLLELNSSIHKGLSNEPVNYSVPLNYTRSYSDDRIENMILLRIANYTTRENTPVTVSSTPSFENTLSESVVKLKCDFYNALKNVSVYQPVTSSYSIDNSDKRIADNRLLLCIDNNNTLDSILNKVYTGNFSIPSSTVAPSSVVFTDRGTTQLIEDNSQTTDGPLREKDVNALIDTILHLEKENKYHSNILKGGNLPSVSSITEETMYDNNLLSAIVEQLAALNNFTSEEPTIGYDILIQVPTVDMKYLVVLDNSNDSTSQTIDTTQDTNDMLVAEDITIHNTNSEVFPGKLIAVDFPPRNDINEEPDTFQLQSTLDKINTKELLDDIRCGVLQSTTVDTANVNLRFINDDCEEHMIRKHSDRRGVSNAMTTITNTQETPLSGDEVETKNILANSVGKNSPFFLVVAARKSPQSVVKPNHVDGVENMSLIDIICPSTESDYRVSTQNCIQSAGNQEIVQLYTRAFTPVAEKTVSKSNIFDDICHLKFLESLILDTKLPPIASTAGTDQQGTEEICKLTDLNFLASLILQTQLPPTTPIVWTDQQGIEENAKLNDLNFLRSLILETKSPRTTPIVCIDQQRTEENSNLNDVNLLPSLSIETNSPPTTFPTTTVQQGKKQNSKISDLHFLESIIHETKLLSNTPTADSVQEETEENCELDTNTQFPRGNGTSPLSCDSTINNTQPLMALTISSLFPTNTVTATTIPPLKQTKSIADIIKILEEIDADTRLILNVASTEYTPHSTKGSSTTDIKNELSGHDNFVVSSTAPSPTEDIPHSTNETCIENIQNKLSEKSNSATMCTTTVNTEMNTSLIEHPFKEKVETTIDCNPLKNTPFPKNATCEENVTISAKECLANNLINITLLRGGYIITSPGMFTDSTERNPLLTNMVTDSSERKPLLTNMVTDATERKPLLTNMVTDATERKPLLTNQSISHSENMKILDENKHLTSNIKQNPAEKNMKVISNDKGHLILQQIGNILGKLKVTAVASNSPIAGTLTGDINQGQGPDRKLLKKMEKTVPTLMKDNASLRGNILKMVEDATPVHKIELTTIAPTFLEKTPQNHNFNNYAVSTIQPIKKSANSTTTEQNVFVVMKFKKLYNNMKDVAKPKSTTMDKLAQARKKKILLLQAERNAGENKENLKTSTELSKEGLKLSKILFDQQKKNKTINVNKLNVRQPHST